jgi:hypothetical protein
MLERWKKVKRIENLSGVFLESYDFSRIMMFEQKLNNLDVILDGNLIINVYFD